MQPGSKVFYQKSLCLPARPDTNSPKEISFFINAKCWQMPVTLAQRESKIEYGKIGCFFVDEDI